MGLATVLEFLLGLVGFFGIGWLVSGFTTTGLFLLVAGIIWDVVAGFVSISMNTLGFVVLGVVNVVVAIISTLVLRGRLQRGR